MKRPLLFILIFLLIGILSFVYVRHTFVLLIIFILILLISIYFAKFYKIKTCKFLFVISILGYIIMFFNTNLSRLEKTILLQKDIFSEGIIKEVNLLQDGNFNVKIKVKNIKIDGSEIKTNFYVSSYLKYNKKIREGYGISFNAKFILGGKPTNPNQFNEYNNLKSNNIDFKAYVKDYKILELEDKFTYFLSNLNYKIGQIYDNILPKEESAILKAMILGDKTYLAQDTIQLYRNSGIYHILAISGLHIGILALFLDKLFSKINGKYSKIFVIIILILYCILTGASLSTIRATFMCCIMFIGSMIYKDYDIISSASFCAVILLIINPYNILNIGFLYSFVSVFSIGLLGMNFVKKYNLTGIKSAFVVSFFVSLAIKPITAYYFYNFYMIDFLLNLIILPFTSLVVCVGFLVSILGMISLGFAEFLVGSVYYILRFFTFMCKIVDNINFNNIQIEKPSIFIIFAFYVMLIFIGYSIYEKPLYRKRQKFLNIGLVIFLACISIELFKKDKFTVTMLDVGQGESIIGEYKNDTFIIDGGGGLSKNVGQKIILPYLKSKNINQIDFVFVSHMDSDHLDGILDIIGNIKIDNIFISDMPRKNKKYFELLDRANKNDISIYPIKKGDYLNLGNDIKFKVLNPQVDLKNNDENNNSIVMQMDYRGSSVLFTGDIEKSGEKKILNYLEDIDILKVAHHGSKTSTIKEFFEKSSPEVSLISTAQNNIYNHPHKEILETINSSKIYRTDEDGAIQIIFGKNTYKIKTFSGRK